MSIDRANPVQDMPDLTISAGSPSPPLYVPLPMQGLEAPPTSFVIGRNAEGQWLAIETHGFGGGIFRSRGDALAYAASETGRRPQAVQLSDEVLALDL